MSASDRLPQRCPGPWARSAFAARASSLEERPFPRTTRTLSTSGRQRGYQTKRTDCVVLQNLPFLRQQGCCVKVGADGDGVPPLTALSGLNDSYQQRRLRDGAKGVGR